MHSVPACCCPAKAPLPSIPFVSPSPPPPTLVGRLLPACLAAAVHACPALQTLLPPLTWALQLLLCQVQVHGAAVTMLLLFMFLMFPSLLLLLLLLMPPLVVFLHLLFLLLLCLCEELFQCAADLLVVLKVTKELTASGNHGLAQHAAQHNAPHMGSVGGKGLGVEGSIGCGYEGYTSSVLHHGKADASRRLSACHNVQTG